MFECTEHTKMREIEARMPYMKHILFKHFHLGGCASCSYGPDDTIADVAAKHNKDCSAIVETVNASLERSREAFIGAQELATLLEAAEKCLLIDVREPWEIDFCKIEGSVILSQSNIQEVFKTAESHEHVVVICHHGLRAFNTTVYMHENNVSHARCLKGGIDAYSVEIDNSIPRY